MFKKERISCYKALILCVIVFIAGEYMLNSLAPLENPPLGRTFHIVAGCGLMTVALLTTFLLIKHLLHLRRKERRRKKNPVPFLDDKKSARNEKKEKPL